MNRRFVLGGAAALAVVPALAGSSSAAETAMSDAQKKHVADTTMAGSLSLASSRIALPKVKHAKLKQFAEFEIAEQETIADILMAMQMPSDKPSGSVKAPSEAEVMKNLDPQGKAMVDKMQSAKAGAAFDRDYVEAQIEGHEKLLKIQEAYLAAPDNLTETDVAKLARGMIKEHLALLADLKKMV